MQMIILWLSLFLTICPVFSTSAYSYSQNDSVTSLRFKGSSNDSVNCEVSVKSVREFRRLGFVPDLIDSETKEYQKTLKLSLSKGALSGVKGAVGVILNNENLRDIRDAPPEVKIDLEQSSNNDEFTINVKQFDIKVAYSVTPAGLRIVNYPFFELDNIDIKEDKLVLNYKGFPAKELERI